MEQKSSPLIIAHKGSSAVAYENSMEAFNLAVFQKADMIELDTHQTSDGTFIIYHDKRIVYDNKKYLISKTPLKVIEKFQLPNGEGIPILEDVLSELLPKIQFNVEIKCKIGKKIFDNLLKRVGQDNSKILVSSFRLDVMQELKSSSLDYKLAFIYRIPSFISKRMASQSHIYCLNADYKFLSSRAIRHYHNKGKKIYAWTVNKDVHIKRAIKLGIDGIITDNPSRTMKIIETI